MTLREKLCQPFDGLPIETVDKLENIVDAEIIAFGEYLDSLTCQDMGEFTIKQLLKIYKNTPLGDFR
jgi:hypothetical protein